LIPTFIHFDYPGASRLSEGSHEGQASVFAKHLIDVSAAASVPDSIFLRGDGEGSHSSVADLISLSISNSILVV
jgi:hypothetical protein